MSERPPGLDDLLNYVAIQLPEEGQHYPMLVHWEDRHTLPAEVCDTCSDPTTGTWVPVSSCDTAAARMASDPDCGYTYGVLRREES